MATAFEQEMSYVERNSAAAGDATPDWMRQALHATLGELRFFFVTLAGFTLHPARFAAEWGSGQRRALNPLAFFATSLALTAPSSYMFHAFLTGMSEGSGAHIRWQISSGIVHDLIPYASAILWAVVSHAVFRVLGSTKPLGATLGVCFYTVGGPFSLFELVQRLSVKLVHRLGSSGRLFDNWTSLLLLASSSTSG